MSVVVPSDLAHANALLGEGSVVLNVWATWAEPCVQLNTVFAELATQHAHLKFVQASAAHSAPTPPCHRHGSSLSP